MFKYEEIILVEGKNDTRKLKKIYPNIETIETNGFDLTKEKINLIRELNKKRKIICLLDPDYSGKKIRNKIINEIPDIEHAFISLKDINDKSLKKGIAEATDKSIIIALENCLTRKKIIDKISWDEYISLNLNNKKKRLRICDKLNIPYYNHKQLFRILNLIDIDYQNLKDGIINE